MSSGVPAPSFSYLLDCCTVRFPVLAVKFSVNEIRIGRAGTHP